MLERQYIDVTSMRCVWFLMACYRKYLSIKYLARERDARTRTAAHIKLWNCSRIPVQLRVDNKVCCRMFGAMLGLWITSKQWNEIFDVHYEIISQKLLINPAESR